MKIASFLLDGQRRVGVLTERGLAVIDTGGADLGALLRQGLDVAGLRQRAAASQRFADPADVTFLPPAAEPPR